MKWQMHDSVSHAMRDAPTIAVEDTIKSLIRKVTGAATKAIVKYNLKMAIKDRNEAVMTSIMAVMPSNSELSQSKICTSIFKIFEKSCIV